MRSSWVSVMVLAGVFAGGVAVGALQQQAATGTRREPQFENEHVRVWKSIIVPNQPLSLHRHDHGRTIIALKGGSLDIVDGNSKTLKTMQWETGKAYWLGVDPAGQQHGDLNRGAEPIEVIVVELKNDVSK
jgi:quercetin dioxygenase-like cupin family protein